MVPSFTWPRKLLIDMQSLAAATAGAMGSVIGDPIDGW